MNIDLTPTEKQVARACTEIALRTLQRMYDSAKSSNLQDALKKDVDAAKAVLAKFS